MFQGNALSKTKEQILQLDTEEAKLELLNWEGWGILKYPPSYIKDTGHH